MPLAKTSASASWPRRAFRRFALLSPQCFEPPRQLTQAALELLTLLGAEGAFAIAAPGGYRPRGTPGGHGRKNRDENPVGMHIRDYFSGRLLEGLREHRSEGVGHSHESEVGRV